jgi:transcriptional regulator with XRE-family HTH domain
MRYMTEDLLSIPTWSATLRAVGRAVREQRALCGLTQEQLARAAGVSQAAASRLEGARSLDAPYRVVLAIRETLRARLAALGAPMPVDDEVDAALPDPLLRRLLRAYQDAPPETRALIVGMVEAAGCAFRQPRAAA